MKVTQSLMSIKKHEAQGNSPYTSCFLFVLFFMFFLHALLFPVIYIMIDQKDLAVTS